MARASASSGDSVRCAACGHLSPAGARFCGGCGNSLVATLACPLCGAPATGNQSFCTGCGAALEGTPAGAFATGQELPAHLAEKVRRAGPALQGERKQVTVLFADVKGSMDLAGSLDPEEWRSIMDGFLKILSAGVHRFEGTIDKFTGDGIMALFGAPIAHEDHAVRACYAALHLRAELEGYSAELQRERGLGFSVRIGLNSGEVVLGTLGDDLSLSYTAIGHTVGLAQRMEALAEPGRAYLGASTAALVEGYFVLSDLGEFNVSGVGGSMRVFELEDVGALRTRMEVSAARGLSLLVGRNQEMAELERSWERAVGGQGQVVGIVAEAGVGKSRLCLEFAQHLRAAGVEVSETRALSHARTVPFLAVLELLRGYFGITDSDEDRTVREKVAGRVLPIDPGLAGALPLIFEFLGAPDVQQPPVEMSPEARQRSLLGALSRLQRAQGARSPGVFLIEDLHWLDPGSETFLENLIDTVPGSRSLVITTFRPDYRAEWMQRSYYRRLALPPLDAYSTDELLASLLGDDPSLDGLAEVIRERVGGNPLFIEEIVRALAEEGALDGDRGAFRLSEEIGGIAIPPTIESVLVARIDRLADREKGILQTASVIGREFSDLVLARVCGLPVAELEAALHTLVAGEFLNQQALYPNAEYTFKHALTEEVAYLSQLAARRTEIHAAVARAVEELDGERLDERAALIAHHWEAAGDLRQAANWSARAAAWAGFTDQLEAVRHWRRVRELTMGVEDGEPAALGLTGRALLLSFAWRLGSVAGLHDDIEALRAEGESLADRLGDRSLKALLLGAYAPTKLVSGELQEGLEIARRAMALAEEAHDLPTQLMIVPGVAYPMCLLGDLRQSLAVTERALDLAAGDRSLGAGLGWTRPYGWAEMWQACVLGWMGRLAEGRAAGERALRASREEGDVENQLWTCTVLAQIAELGMDGGDFALSQARSACELAENAGGIFGQVLARTGLGAAYMLAGEWAAAVEEVEWALRLARERHSALDVEAWNLARLARARLGNGDVKGATAAATEGLQHALARGIRLHEIPARIELARTQIATASAGESVEIRRELQRALGLGREIGTTAFEPQVHLAFAELARAAGDEELAESELGESRALLAHMTGGDSRSARESAHRGLRAP
jgi:class 3 adenylate cyclase/tetratricopeptide (TPR) repeat protein